MQKLDDRIKVYEKIYTEKYVPNNLYKVIRIDGKCFHTYTKYLDKPFDYNLVKDMINTMFYLCENIQGAIFGFCQSDEISIILKPSSNQEEQSFFNGKVQKIVSISASMATAKFNSFRENELLAHFDSRVFCLPDVYEVINYLIWRQQDILKNSKQMLARAHFSHKQLQNKNGLDLVNMLNDLGVDYETLPPQCRLGTCCYKKNKQINTENGIIERKKFIINWFNIHQNRDMLKILQSEE